MKNILGTELISCSFDPLTGYFRNGYCQTDERDRGSHVVASVMSEEFLKFTKSVGNDLSTPNPIYNFPGLKSGDRWCLCALRWKEAYDIGSAIECKLSSLISTRHTQLRCFSCKHFIDDVNPTCHSNDKHKHRIT